MADRAPGTPLICAIESARGLLAAAEIAAVPGVRHLAMGGVDLRRDLNAGGGNLQTLYVRSHLVVASRAAGLEPPIDSVYPRLDDDAGLREQAEFARSLGFFGKSAIHPRQLAVLHEVFTPTAQEVAWAREVLAAFAAAGGDGAAAAQRRVRRPARRRPRPPRARARRHLPVRRTRPTDSQERPVLVILGFLMIAVFMYLIMSRRATPVAALILVPVAFGIAAGAGGDIGDMVMEAVGELAPTAALLFFAITYFGIMIDVGLFDRSSARSCAWSATTPSRSSSAPPRCPPSSASTVTARPRSSS